MTRTAQRTGALALVLALACGKTDRAEEAKEKAEVGATVGTVTVATFRETVEAVGTVTPRVGHVASLAAPSPTRVAKVFVAAGASVQAGDPLVELEQAPFAAAMASANAALATAEAAAARAKRLADAGVSPRKEAEVAAAELATAQLNALTARRANELSTLRAPMAGVVTRMSAVMGASVEPNQSLAEVADASLLDIVLLVSPADAERVHAGQSVAVEGGAGTEGAPGATARVADISPSVDSASRGVAVRAEVATGARMLRIGASVQARIFIAEHGKATIVPADALVPTGEGFKVFVVGEDGMALSRDVTVGGRGTQGVWISKGLTAGERIVTHGAYGMDDSAKVASPDKKDDEKADKKDDKQTDKKDDKKAAPAAKKP